MAAALFCLSPVVVAELSKAYVDVAFGCFFLIALNAALAFHHAPSGGKTLQFAIALGIFAGTKMPGLVFSLLILLPLFAVLLFSASRRGARTAPVCPGRVAALLAAGCALFLAAGGWWYVRNLLATGNPVFPLNVDLFGISFFEGAYDRSALPPSNVTTLLDLHTPHFLWLLSAGALLTAGAALLARDGKGLARRALRFGLLLPAAMAAIFHGLLPFDYARFVLALCGLAGALLLVPLDSRHGRWAGIALLAVLTAAFLCNEERGKLLLPLLEARLLSTWQVWLSFAAVIAAGLCSALLLLFRWPRPWKTLLAILLALAAFGAFEAGGIVADAEGPFFIEAFRKSREPYIFLDRNYGNVTVAYSGTNRSFLLYGGNLANRVCHVNVNRCPGWLFHDYVQRFTGDRSARRKDRNGVAYTRSDARYPAWAANLDSAGADLLFVERLTPWNLEKSYRRDGQGFPLEAIWADGHPGKFKRVFASPVVRIYEILP